MKTLLTKLAGTAAALALISPAMAASDYGGGQGYRYFDQRSETQHQRIRQGEQNGRLTPEEADRLYQDQHRLERMERKFRADGRLSASERESLETAYNDASYRIYRLKHNRYFDGYSGRRYDNRDQGGHGHHGQERPGDTAWSGRNDPYASWHERGSSQVGWDDHSPRYPYQDRSRDQSDWHH